MKKFFRWLLFALGMLVLVPLGLVAVMCIIALAPLCVLCVLFYLVADSAFGLIGEWFNTNRYKDKEE